jgi:hypothetical protein
MAYSQGGLIEATDYNNIVGTNTSVSGTTLNGVWAWGGNSRGYGQTPVSSVSTTNVVTATQWATLINTLNSSNIHINGTGSGLTANTTGQIIGFSGGLQTKINGVNSDRLLFASNSATVINNSGLTAYAAWTSTTTTSTLTRAFGAQATFASADRARFFFNAGGRIKFNITATSDAVARSVAAKAVVDYMGGIALFGANTSGGRTGTGGTLNTNLTNVGYYGLTTANVNFVSVTSVTTNYTTDTGTIAVRTNGPIGSFRDNGTQLQFWATINSTSGGNADGSFDDSLSLTVTVTMDVSYPETTNLSNTWGAVTVTRL